MGQYNPDRSSRQKSPAHYDSCGSCATYSAQDIIVMWCLQLNMIRLRLIIRNPAYDRSSEDEEIDPIDLALLISCLITPIVTAPAEDEDKAEDRVQDRVEDRVGDKDGDEDDSPPVMVTDESLSNEDVRLTAEEVEQFLNEWRSSADYVALSPVEDEENQSDWDPPSNLLEREYQFPNATSEVILEQLYIQVRN